MRDWQSQRAVIAEQIEALEVDLCDRADKRCVLALDVTLGTGSEKELAALEATIKDTTTKVDRLRVALVDVDRRQEEEERRAQEKARRADAKRHEELRAVHAGLGKQAAGILDKLAAVCAQADETEGEIVKLRQRLEISERVPPLAVDVAITLSGSAEFAMLRGHLGTAALSAGAAAHRRLRVA